MRLQMGLVPFLLLLAACASKPVALGGASDLRVTRASELPAPTPMDAHAPSVASQIGIGDRLTVVVFGVPELSLASAPVETDGRIILPLVGGVKAQGLTPDELATTLSARLTRYVRNPQVTVSLTEPLAKVVTVTGDVKEPGQYPVTWNSTLMTAVASAKGSTEFSRLDDVVVFRNVQGQRYAALYDMRAIQRGTYPDPKIYPNDIIMVGDSPGRRLFRDLLQAAPALLSPLIYILN